MDYEVWVEITLWIALFFWVLVFLSLFGFGGAPGRFISGACFGLFGILAYVLPPLAFIVMVVLIYPSDKVKKYQCLGASLFYVILCAVMQIVQIGESSGLSASEFYEAGKTYRIGGGLVGGVIVSNLTNVFGLVFTCILLVLLALICLLLIVQRSLMRGLHARSSQLREQGERSAAERRERRDQWLDEREEQRRIRSEQKEERTKVSVNTLPAETVKRRSAARSVPVPTLVDVDEKRYDKTTPAKSAGKKAAQAGSVRSLSDYFADFENQDQDEAIPETSCEPKAMETLRNAGRQEKETPRAGKAAAEKTAASKADNAWMDHIVGLEEETSMPEAAPEPSFGETAEVKHTGKAASATEAGDIPVPEADVPKEKTESTRRKRSTPGEISEGIADVEKEIEQKDAAAVKEYVFPSIELLSKPSAKKGGTSREELAETAERLQEVFATFGVNVKITNVTCGPSVTRFELTPEMGVKVSKILSLQDDIQLNLAASDIRIEAPIPGKAAIGIEVPNKTSSSVMLRDLIESDPFRNASSKISFAVGKDIGGKIIVGDIAKMPHLLIAGSTGSGKSVFINTLIMSILYKARPDEVRLIMVDPKVVELSVYNGIPHLLIPVVTDPKKAAGALNWAVAEMMNRYQKFADTGVRDLKSYNKRVENIGDDVPEEDRPEKMPQIVIIVDELADLMMVASAEVEDAICRLAQLARAAGIHLVIATQRPSVDVITGLIKANMPSRIAFAVSSGVDSRTILDQNGAEKLLGNGDMLYSPQTFKMPLRTQGAYVSDQEVAAVVKAIKENNGGAELEVDMKQQMEAMEKTISTASASSDVDELFADAGRFIIEKDKASIGMLQRWFKIGFNRAARIMDQLSDAGVVGPEEGTKPRKVLMSMEQFENYLEQN